MLLHPCTRGRSNFCFKHQKWSGPTGWPGSWSVGLWLNCWAVKQQSVSICKVKMSQLLHHGWASQLKDIQNFYCLNVLSGWMWLVRVGMTQVNHYSLLILPIYWQLIMPINTVLLDPEESIPAGSWCCFLWPCQQFYNLSSFHPRRLNHSFDICQYPECN